MDAPQRTARDDAAAASTTPRRASSPARGRGLNVWLVGLVVLIVAVVVLGLSLALQPGVEPVSVTRPSQQAPSLAATPSGSPSESPSSTPSPSTTPSAAESSTAAAPLPGTVSAAPVGTPTPEPSPEGSSTPSRIDLNDAQFLVADGWSVYGDELIEDDRRAVRLSDGDTDARLQAVTLGASSTSLADSCTSLVDLQQTQFTAPTRNLVVPIGVGAAAGSGVRCGFSGVRTSDGVTATVMFTLVSRASDSHVLMLRSTVPGTVPADSPAIGQLTSMSCQASQSFGVPLPLC